MYQEDKLMGKELNNQKGYTLIEVLLALAIGSIVIMGFFSVFWSTSNAYEWGSTSVDNQYMARRAMRDIEKDIKEATSININQEAKQLVLNEERENEIVYYVREGNLIRSYKKASLPIAENVKDIEFEQSDNGLVTVMVEVESQGRKYILNNSVYPRVLRP
ncbi:MAG: prepilin-type N-terminal cleavage/methylation domain-containing protein [Syntrophomonadaceae bacterium]|nr:prepilin-type N-terminal cleavage/methylation domain-containing protein [Syntrophomonadaceae bacterium]